MDTLRDQRVRQFGHAAGAFPPVQRGTDLRDEHPLAFATVYHAFLRQGSIGLLHRVRIDEQPHRQFTHRGQPLARHEPSLGDAKLHLPDDLHIDRVRTGWIKRKVHSACLWTRVLRVIVHATFLASRASGLGSVVLRRCGSLQDWRSRWFCCWNVCSQARGAAECRRAPGSGTPLRCVPDYERESRGPQLLHPRSSAYLTTSSPCPRN